MNGAAKKIERCNSCVLPKSDFFNFDASGTCNLCTAAKPVSVAPKDTANSADELNVSIERVRKRGRKQSFDCVVGLSGGRDSSYLLYLLVHTHHLRCLATYYRTPFTSDVIDANVRRLTTKLNVPLVEMDISKELHRQVARAFVTLWVEKPYPVIANMACAVCKLVNREIYKIARANGVKSIIFGANIFESVQIASGIPQNKTLIDDKATKQLSLGIQLHRTIMLMKKGITALGTSASLWKYIPLGFQASIMYICLHTPYLRLRYPTITPLEYFYFDNWNQAECEKVLFELGWKLPPGCRSTWKADCSFAELKNLMFQKMTGATYLDAFLSNMVRSGVLSRDEALRRVEVEGAISQERLAEVCRILELPNSFLKIFDQETTS